MWLENGGYNFVDFLQNQDRTNLSLKGRKLKALKLLYNKLLKMNICTQQRIGEVIWGRLFQQDFYASKQRNLKNNTTAQQNIVSANEYHMTLRDSLNNNQVLA